MMKKIYLEPGIKIASFAEEYLMEVISLPTTGSVDNQSIGEAKEYDNFVEDDEGIISVNNVWDD